MRVEEHIENDDLFTHLIEEIRDHQMARIRTAIQQHNLFGIKREYRSQQIRRVNRRNIYRIT